MIMMTIKTTALLFFCISNLTIHAMHNLTPMQRIVDNLHENSKKQLVKSPTSYNYKQDPLRAKERQKTMSLKREREYKNNFYLSHGK